MNLIDRYVNEIGRRLPRSQRDEVRQEIRSSLLDALETRVEGVPTEGDQVALIKELGRPEEVAASYRPSDQYLIGPELYPTFKTVLSAVVGSLIAAFVAIFAIQVAFRSGEAPELGHRLLGLIDSAFGSILVSAAIVVAIFAILQRREIRPEETERDWDPRELPFVRAHDLVSRGGAVAGIVIPAIFLALLYAFRDRIGFVVSPGDQLLLNDVFRQNLPLISVALILGIALQTVLFWRGRWQWATRMADFAIDVFGVWILYRIASGMAENEHLLMEAGLPQPLPRMIVGIAWSIVVFVAAVTVLEALRTLYRSVKAGPAEPVPRPPAHSGA